MTAPTCAEVQESLGVLVLGALDPAERETVEAHVRVCPPCAAVLAELAPLPGLLNRAASSEIDIPASPPAHVLDRALAEVHRGEISRRRRTLTVLAAAAAVLLVLAAAFVVRATRSPEQLVASGASHGVSAKVVLTPVPSGTSLALTLSGVTPGEHCQLVAVSSNGTSDVASSWEATYDGEASVSGTTAFDVADITRLDITTPEGALLVSMPVTT